MLSIDVNIWLHFVCVTLATLKGFAAPNCENANAVACRTNATSTTASTTTSSQVTLNGSSSSPTLSSATSNDVSTEWTKGSTQQSQATGNTRTTVITTVKTASNTVKSVVTSTESTDNISLGMSGSNMVTVVMASVTPTITVLIVVFFLVYKRKMICKQNSSKQENKSHVNNICQSFHNVANINHADLSNDSGYADIPLDTVNVGQDDNAFAEYQTIDCVADETNVISTDYGHLRAHASVLPNNTYALVDGIFKMKKRMPEYSHLQTPIETTKDETKHFEKTNTNYDKLGMKNLTGKELHSSNRTHDDGSMYNHITAVRAGLLENNAWEEADNYSHVKHSVNHGSLQVNAQSTEQTERETKHPREFTFGEQNGNDQQKKSSHDYFILEPSSKM